MAIVPTQPLSTVKPQATPPAYQDASAATPAAFGAGQDAALANGAQQIQDVSDKTANIALAIQSRQNAVSRARDLSNFQQQVQNQWQKVSTEQDISDPKVTQGFTSWLDGQIAQTVGQHDGGPASQQLLNARLMDARTEWVAHVGAAGNAAQDKAVQDTMGTTLNTISATHAPLSDQWKRWEGAVNDMAPALGANRAKEMLQHGQAMLATSVIQNFIDLGQPDQAQHLLDTTPGLNEVLTPQLRQQIESKITVSQAQAGKTIRQLNAKAAWIESMTGKKLTPQQYGYLAGLPKDPAGPQTLSDKVVQFTTVMRGITGNPNWAPSAEQVAKMAGAQSPQDQLFGNGTAGRALALLTDKAPLFSAGLTTPEEDRQYIAAYSLASQPVAMLDPVTKQVVYKTPQMPQFVVNALTKRGFNPNDVLSPPQAGDSNSPDPTTQPGSTQPPSADQHPALADPAGAADTIFSLNHKGLVTGPLPAIGDLAGRTPGLGDFISTPEMTQARQKASILQQSLVNVLRTNTRYTESERKDIENVVASIEPRSFDTADSYQNRIIAIDKELGAREQNAMRTGQDKSLPVQDRMQARHIANAIAQFRDQLGVPPTYNTKQDVDKAVASGKLHSGDYFLDPHGVVRQVP